MAQVPDLVTFRELIAQLDHSIGYPGVAVEGSRGRAGSPKQPHLPDGWLDSRILGDAERLGLIEAELDISAAKHLCNVPRRAVCASRRILFVACLRAISRSCNACRRYLLTLTVELSLWLD